MYVGVFGIVSFVAASGRGQINTTFHVLHDSRFVMSVNTHDALKKCSVWIQYTTIEGMVIIEGNKPAKTPNYPSRVYTAHRDSDVSYLEARKYVYIL